jgi:hypothetical protein
MTDLELTALLDAHDALVKACLDGVLPFADFLMAYDDFPQRYGLDGHGASPDEHAVLRRSRHRIGFHRRVSEVLSGLTGETDVSLTESDVARFIPGVGLARLRALVARYPNFSLDAPAVTPGSC